MAVRTVKPLKHGAVLDFIFELSTGVRVSARGQVAWVNSEGMAGIMLQTLRGKGGEQLNAWLAAREKMELKETLRKSEPRTRVSKGFSTLRFTLRTSAEAARFLAHGKHT